MHKPESLLNNEMHEILYDSKIQTDYQISVRISNLVLINMKKKTCHLVDFTITPDHRRKIKEIEKIDKYLDLARELKCCGI